MRYALVNGAPSKVTKLTYNGMFITNPSDELVDEAGVGYPLLETEAPEYDPDEERISFQWEVVQDADPESGSVIMKVWTVIPLTAEEKAVIHNQEIDNQIRAVNADFEQFKTTPVEYTFKDSVMKLRPIWTTEYYGTLQQVSMIVGDTVFPTIITDADGVNFEMTREEFTQMYLWLVQVSQTKIADVNARLAELEGERL